MIAFAVQKLDYSPVPVKPISGDTKKKHYLSPELLELVRALGRDAARREAQSREQKNA